MVGVRIETEGRSTCKAKWRKTMKKGPYINSVLDIVAHLAVIVMIVAAFAAA